ncbi:MAG: primase C-terminal domain-containing protein [Pelodictyon phaeoclathratiforme]
MSEQDGKVLISYKAGLNEQDPAGFKEYRVSLDIVASMVKKAGQYSATPFRDEYRDAAHALPGAELMILDYDDGLSVTDAQSAFCQYMGFIATTRSHRKEKNGVVCDRFRVILPTRTPIMLGTEDFRAMMKVVINHYGPDRACCNISRMYYGYSGAEVLFLDGCRLFDWEPFYQSAQDQERQRRQRQQQQRFRQHQSEDRKAVVLDKAIQTFMQKNFVAGARNTTLFRLTRWLHDEGVDDVAGVVAEQNRHSCCPLPDDEVKKIVKSIS